MSTFRFVGNAILTGLSKFASGYWSIGDPQNGYTAISRDAIERLDLEAITDQYGFLNHLLTHLNVAGCRVADVPMTAIYGDEESSIRYVPFVRYVSPVVTPELLLAAENAVRGQIVQSGHRPLRRRLRGLAVGLAGLGGSLVRVARGNEAATASLASFAAILIGLVSLGSAIQLDAEANEDLELPCDKRDATTDRTVGCDATTDRTDKRDEGPPAQSIE